METSEAEKLGRLAEALEVVDRWDRLTGSASGAWEVSADSDLARDNAVTHPREVSPAAWAAISAAVSHLACLRESVFRDQDPNTVSARIHTHGQLTLVRGALENASMAVWLLTPDQRIERVLRRLQQDWDEVRQLDITGIAMGSSPPKTLGVHLQELTGIATCAGVDPSKIKMRPGYGDIVKSTGDSVSTGATLAFVIWKACSSIAHGELRGMIAYLKNRRVGSTVAGMQLNQVEGNVDLVATGGLVAIATTRRALALYRMRAGSQISI
jgi:hypothetical protein